MSSPDNSPTSESQRRAILALVTTGPLVLALALAWRLRADPFLATVAVGVGILLSLGFARAAWLGSWWSRRTWRAFAEEHGYDFEVGMDGEPQISGIRDSVSFRVSLASPRLSGRGHYVRTYATAAIPGDVPEGLRLYRRSSTLWKNKYSGLRTVVTGEEILDLEWFVEGEDEADVIAYLRDEERRSAVIAAGERWSDVIIFGLDEGGLPISTDEEASGAVTHVEIGRWPKRKLAGLIDELCACASALAR